MFRPSWPPSGVYWVRLLLFAAMRVLLRRPQVSFLGCALFICNVWCVMLELLVYLYYRLMYIWCYLRFCMWLSCVFLLGRECAILLSGHLGFIVLECFRDVCVTDVRLLKYNTTSYASFAESALPLLLGDWLPLCFYNFILRTLTNQNLIRREIKSRLNSSTACYRSVQKFLSSRLLSKTQALK
jgi:hypothetical protein